MSGFGLSRERFALLFAVMLVAASGNTAMQSLMPAIGRELGIPDIWVAIGFSLSAILWVFAAPHWARRADRTGRRALMRIGLYGFISSMLICGLIVAAGLAELIPPILVFPIFILGRAIYGAWGSASPPAVQAYVAARTEGEQRTNALAAIASSFGLGTIIGPAIATLGRPIPRLRDAVSITRDAALDRIRREHGMAGRTRHSLAARRTSQNFCHCASSTTSDRTARWARKA